MNAKSWYQSRTFMFNIIVIVLAVATMIADPQFAFDPSVVKIALGVLTIGNAALRLLTDSPIEGTRAAQRQAAMLRAIRK